MEKCGKFRKNGRFSGRIWPDWGNTTRADMARLGSIGLTYEKMLTALHQVPSVKVFDNIVKKCNTLKF